MKRFIFILSFPPIIIFSLLFILVVGDESKGFNDKIIDIDISQHCAKADDFISCVYSDSHDFNQLIHAYQREPYPDNEHAKNDKGACDTEFLGSFRYVEEDYDNKNRANFLSACSNWYIGYATEILLGKDFSSEDLQNLAYPWHTNNISKSKRNDFIKFMDAGSFGRQNICEDQTTGNLICLFSKSTFNTKANVFNLPLFLVALIPLLFTLGISYFIYTKISPIFSINSVNWMQNKKSFRIFLVSSSIWAAIFLTYSMIENYTINPFDDEDAWFPLILGLYPLIVFLITYFIVSADDAKETE